MALPITFGVTTMSVIICTMIKTARALRKMAQKFSPVSAAFRMAKKTVGMRAKEWR